MHYFPFLSHHVNSVREKCHHCLLNCIYITGHSDAKNLIVGRCGHSCVENRLDVLSLKVPESFLSAPVLRRGLLLSLSVDTDQGWRNFLICVATMRSKMCHAGFRAGVDGRKFC